MTTPEALAADDPPYQRHGRTPYWSRVWGVWYAARAAGDARVYAPSLESLRVAVADGLLALVRGESLAIQAAGSAALRRLAAVPACTVAAASARPDLGPVFGEALYEVETLVGGRDLGVAMEAVRRRDFERYGLPHPSFYDPPRLAHDPNAIPF